MTSCRLLPILLLGVALTAFAEDHAPPPVTPATSFPAVEVHDAEHLAIAVEPYETKDKQELFNFHDYYKYGVYPIRLIITNNGDHPISLREARILFQSADGQRVQAAEPEDVERLMGNYDPRPMAVPTPLPGIHFHHKNHNKQIEDDFNQFEYQALVVEPHTTRAGFLFYVLTSGSNPLRGADLYVNDLRSASGQQFFPFQVPFNKYLNAKSGH